MEDNKIIELYWERSETAIKETKMKYGELCKHIAENILANKEDAEECLNDVFLVHGMQSLHTSRIIYPHTFVESLGIYR